MDVRERIKGLMDERGWTRYRLRKKSDIPQTTLDNIFLRDTVPTIATLELICKAFGISMAQFFAEDDEPVTLTPSQKALLERWSRLDEDQQAAVFQIIDKM
ncbi:MAG: helix-turn-helix transcriptional regulator [Oscillospiraceae bacterium]|nr:helix-turn-helix transcriptional regulator [Oscillospiraceae bacterium]